MISNGRRLLLSHDVAKMAATSVFAVFLVMVAFGPLWSQDEPVPARIKDVKMGASSSSVVEMIKPQGTRSEELIPKEGRKKLTWVITDDPQYDNLQFQFTQKDRLYMIRFSLKKELWRKSLNLKKAFFQKFGISPDQPLKMRVKDQEILIYGAEPGRDCDFLDFTEASTGEKWFVLVNKKISIDDRTEKGGESQGENKSN